MNRCGVFAFINLKFDISVKSNFHIYVIFLAALGCQSPGIRRDSRANDPSMIIIYPDLVVDLNALYRSEIYALYHGA